MRAQEVKQQVRLREWAEQINACKQSRLTVKQWCKENGIHIKTYYNRMKRVREELLVALGNGDGGQELWPIQPGGRSSASAQQELSAISRNYPSPKTGPTVFAALPMPRVSGIAVTVHIGTHVAEVHSGTDAETMESVLRTLSRL